MNTNKTRLLFVTILFWLCFFQFSIVYADGYVIVTFGDSITLGQGAIPYSTYLQSSVGSCATVINQGLSGEKTGGGVSRIDGVLEAYLPDYVLIMEGTNDAYWEESASTVKYNLARMIDKVRAYGAVPILSNLTPDTRDSGLGGAIPSTYNPKINSLASDMGVTVIDAYNNLVANWDSLTVDGVHPNAAGAQALSSLFYSALPVCSSGSSGGGGGGGGCFIATAAFGSSLEPHVAVLKQFRDQILLKTKVGEKFVQAYYTYSPPLAGIIEQYEWLQAIVRLFLYPLVGLSYLLLLPHGPVITFAGMTTCILIAMSAVLYKKNRAGRRLP